MNTKNSPAQTAKAVHILRKWGVPEKKLQEVSDFYWREYERATWGRGE